MLNLWQISSGGPAAAALAAGRDLGLGAFAALCWPLLLLAVLFAGCGVAPVLWAAGPPLLASQVDQVGPSSVASMNGWLARHLAAFRANTWSQNFASTPMLWLLVEPKSLAM